MAVYGVVVSVSGVERVAYEGTDYTEAERIALRRHRWFGGRGYVSVMRDGGTWRDVKHIPGNLASARVTEAGGCLHAQCGQINPLSCYCREHLSEEDRAYYAREIG